MEANRNKRGTNRSSDLARGSLSIWTLVFKYADSKDRALVVLGILGSIADGLALPTMMTIVSRLVNLFGKGPSADHGGFLHSVNQSSLYFIYAAAAIFVAAFLEAFCWAWTAERLVSRMRRKYLRAVLRQDVGFFDMESTTTSQVVTSISNDTLAIQDLLSEKVPNFIMNAATFIGSFVVGFYMIWRLALVTCPFTILLIVPGIIYGRTLVGIGGKLHATYHLASNLVEQSISSVRTVFSFVGEDRIMAKFSSALEGTVKLGLKQGLAKGMAIGSTGIVFAIWAFMCWYGSTLVMYHGANGGKVFITGSAIIIGGLALGTALPNIKYFSEACIAGYRIFKIIDRVPEIDSDDTTGETLPMVFGEVEFRNVEFAYPSRPDIRVLNNLSLTIPAGQTVALVGGSGSGKSTVIALVERFYDALSGQILLDGVDIRTMQLKWMRSQIALVSQEPALFATSIKENILFGKENATMNEVIAAAKSANAHNFISLLPNGYDTQVGERGAQMSGGQKQRIAIARAMIRDPRILLLDEATSALDAESEKIVQVALDQASVGRTTLIVAHRLSTVRNADVITVLRSGEVTEYGRHEDLIQKTNGAYAALVQLQQRARDVSKDETDAIDDGRIPRRRHNSMSSTRSSEFDESANQVTEDVQIRPPSLGRLLRLNAPEWKNALMGSLGAIGYGTIQPLQSFTFASMISMFFLKDHDEMKTKVKIFSSVFCSLAVASMVFNLLQHYNFAAMGEFLTKRIREQMLSKVLTFEIGWFDQDENSSGAVCSRIATEANVVKSLVGDRLSLIVQTLSGVILAFTMGLVIAWRLAIVMIAVQPLIIMCFYSRKVLLKKTSNKGMKAQGEGSQLAAEAVTNHRTITAFSSQERILRLFQNAQDGPRRDNIKQSWIAGLVLGTSQFFTFCNWSLIYWYGGHLLHKGAINSESFFKTYFILISTGRVIADAGSMTSDLAKGSRAVESVFAILDRKSLISPDDPEGLKPEKIEGKMELKKVDFAYPSRPQVMLFQNFSLRIKPGSSVALVGQSGSGKSTIVGLVERFYDPLKGMIKIDGRDIRSFNLRALRKHIALVGQEPVLFTGTIRENIHYGKENATEAEMIEAAKSANAHDFISCMKDGYDTKIGDRGMQLSGGQKQRIAIARAIIKNPAILLLDEATSALDSHSESVVQEALDRNMVGRTSVIIAHRLSTIQNVHSIAVIEGGKIVEQGNHFELLRKGEGSPYFALVSLQEHRQN